MLVFLRESHGPEAPLDLRGVSLIAAGALGIVWGLQRAGAAGWSSVEVVGALGGGAVLLACFVAWELLPWTIPSIVITPLAGALADRLPERSFLIGGPLLQALGLGWLGTVAEPGVGYGALVLPLLLAGIGIAATILAAHGGVDSPERFSDGFAPAIALTAAFSTAGAVVALALPGRPRVAVRAVVPGARRAPGRG